MSNKWMSSFKFHSCTLLIDIGLLYANARLLAYYVRNLVLSIEKRFEMFFFLEKYVRRRRWSRCFILYFFIALKVPKDQQKPQIMILYGGSPNSDLGKKIRFIINFFGVDLGEHGAGLSWLSKLCKIMICDFRRFVGTA